jgi:hypothetical protein
VHREHVVAEGFLLDHAARPEAVDRRRRSSARLIHRASAISEGRNRSVCTLGDDSNLREDNISWERAVQSSVGFKLGIGMSKSDSKAFSFLSFPLAGVVSSGAVPLDAFNSPLLLLVVGLGSLARRKVGLGLRELLAP